MSIDAPCKDCPDRDVTDTYNCHMHCEKYINFQAEKTAYNEKQATTSKINYIDYKRRRKKGRN